MHKIAFRLYSKTASIIKPKRIRPYYHMPKKFAKQNEEPDITYKIENGIRFVEPYIFKFETYAKGRWLGRSLYEVMSSEFGSQTDEYWLNGIKEGNILVNHRAVNVDYKLQNSDLITHVAHRHEPPCTGVIQLVGDTPTMMAVNKPPSLPMHPCGSYRYNSLTKILEKEHLIPNQPRLHTVHRLDRMTSGLVVIAKSPAVANVVSKQIQNNETKKTYVARIKGRLPTSIPYLQCFTTPPSASEYVDTDNNDDAEITGTKRKIDTFSSPPQLSLMNVDDYIKHKNIGYYYNEESKTLEVHCPVGAVSFRDGVHCCHPEGKPSLSYFRTLKEFSDGTSIVECVPCTGRTHQLRLHLQLIGTPIANDPCYGGELFFGEPDKRATAEAVLEKYRSRGGTLLGKVLHYKTAMKDEVESPLTSTQVVGKSTNTNEHKELSLEERVVANCRFCQEDHRPEDERLLHCDGIWLHALRYAGVDWAFETEMPAWADREDVLSGL